MHTRVCAWYSRYVQRLTITVDDDLANVARAAVDEGRAPSISAWVSDAMRQKALARLRLELEFDHLRAVAPYSDDAIAWAAEVFGISVQEMEAFARTPLHERGDK